MTVTASKPLLALLLTGGSTLGQTTAGHEPLRMVIDMKPGETHVETPPRASGGRWLRLDTASISTRYRFVDNFSGVTTASQQQHQVALSGEFRVDRSGRLRIHAGLFTGNTFLGGWASTGPGTGAARSNLYLKQLFVRFTPVTGLEIQYGGLAFARGESSEITSYDADGYLVGQRLRIERPNSLYFDELSVTYGRVGDFNRASVFHRLGRLGRSDYHQFLLAKRIHRRVRASADYSWESGRGTFRQAVTVLTPRVRVADLVRFEQYLGAGAPAGHGFAVYGEKSLARRLRLGGGYTKHDRGGLYSDRFNAGKYVFGNALFAFNSCWSLSALVTRGISSPNTVAPRTRVDLAIGYNLRPALGRTGWF